MELNYQMLKYYYHFLCVCVEVVLKIHLAQKYEEARAPSVWMSTTPLWMCTRFCQRPTEQEVDTHSSLIFPVCTLALTGRKVRHAPCNYLAYKQHWYRFECGYHMVTMWNVWYRMFLDHILSECIWSIKFSGDFRGIK